MNKQLDWSCFNIINSIYLNPEAFYYCNRYKYDEKNEKQNCLANYISIAKLIVFITVFI